MLPLHISESDRTRSRQVGRCRSSIHNYVLTSANYDASAIFLKLRVPLQSQRVLTCRRPLTQLCRTTSPYSQITPQLCTLHNAPRSTTDGATGKIKGGIAPLIIIWRNSKSIFVKCHNMYFFLSFLLLSHKCYFSNLATFFLECYKS